MQEHRKKVEFLSEGHKIVGNLFRPDNFKEGDALPAVVMAGPMTGVKEQVAGLWAERLAKAGFITLAFDHRNFGESEGIPRQHEDPAKKIEDLKNAISFLASLPEVDASKIAACGISMGGGYVLQLAAWDRRIKAASIVASGLNLGDTFLEMMGKEALIKRLEELNASRQKHYDTCEVQYIPAVATGGKPAAMTGDEPFEYYGTSRSWSAGWVNRYTTESIENLMSFNAVPYAHHVSPTPLLIIHGKNDKYCPPKFAQEVFDKAREPKVIMWVDAPNHIDLYDVEKYLEPAVNKTVEWFNKYLNGKPSLKYQNTKQQD
jgi:fermentation-respiration switch protein FrsA (DUF1100 family)